VHAGAFLTTNDRTHSGFDAWVDQRIARKTDKRINALVAQNTGDRISSIDDSESL
jgi:hypothetical protein